MRLKEECFFYVVYSVIGVYAYRKTASHLIHLSIFFSIWLGYTRIKSE